MKIPITKQYPLLLPLLFFILGIYISTISTFQIAVLLGISFFGIVVCILSNRIHFQYTNAKTILFLLGLICGFVALGIISRQKYASEKTKNIDWSNGEYRFVLVESPKVNKKFTRIQAVCINANDTFNHAHILLISPNTTEIATLKNGDTIFTKISNAKPITNFNSDFDAKTHYARMGIYHSSFLDTNRTVIFPRKQIWFESFSANLKCNILSKLKLYFKNEDDFGLAVALFLGDTQYLDADIYDQYIDTGTVHVIAVSGMHLSILYGLLMYIFSIFPYIKNKKWMQYVLILIFIWLFSFLVGMGPSILRAACMLSFSLLGSFIGRRNGGLNGMILSAFILLSIDPNWLWNIGFLLSYFSLLGILLWMPVFEKIGKVQNPILKFITEILFVTIAAQLGTFPIILYCFHQFPIWFLFFNVLLIPISTVAILMLIGFLIIAWMEPLANAMSFLTQKVLRVMNSLADFSTQLPFSTIKITIDGNSVILLYTLIGLIYGLILYKRKIYLWCVIGILFLKSLEILIRTYI